MRVSLSGLKNDDNFIKQVLFGFPALQTALVNNHSMLVMSQESIFTKN